MINGYREREREILHIEVKTNENVRENKRKWRERERERDTYILNENKPGRRREVTPLMINVYRYVHGDQIVG